MENAIENSIETGVYRVVPKAAAGQRGTSDASARRRMLPRETAVNSAQQAACIKAHRVI